MGAFGWQMADTFIKLVGASDGGMGKLLIATVYNADAVLVAAHKLGPDRLMLLVQENRDKELKEALKLIHDSLGRVIEITEKSVPAYDIVAIAQAAVDLIDAQPSAERIFVNITSGRKTMAIGLLFGAYARVAKVEKIGYNTEESKAVVYLPKLGFNLTNSQVAMLAYLELHGGQSIAQIANEVELSRAQAYNVLRELQNMDLIKDDDGIWLTDAGKIARM